MLANLKNSAVGTGLEKISSFHSLRKAMPKNAQTISQLHQSDTLAKETISKVKRQPSEWEKIIANETTDKGLICKIYKEFIQFNTRKTNNPIKK